MMAHWRKSYLIYWMAKWNCHKLSKEQNLWLLFPFALVLSVSSVLLWCAWCAFRHGQIWPLSNVARWVFWLLQCCITSLTCHLLLRETHSFLHGEVSTVWTINDVLSQSIPLELSRSIPLKGYGSTQFQDKSMDRLKMSLTVQTVH